MAKIFAILFLITTYIFGVQITKSDEGTYVFLNQQLKPISMQLRLSKNGELWEINLRENNTSNWAALKCENSCELRESNSTELSSYLNIIDNSASNKYELGCIQNTVKSFCKISQKNSKKTGYALMMPSIKQSKPIFLIKIQDDTPQKPNITVETKGEITNYTVQGSLAPTNPNIKCMTFNEASNTLTPPDIYLSSKDCVLKNRFEDAANLYVFGSAYTIFDIARVADNTVSGARTMMQMKAYKDMPEEMLDKLNAYIKDIHSENKEQQFCKTLEKIGKPNYFPTYLILHGMKAFTGDPYQNALKVDFDSKTKWNDILTNLKCRTKANELMDKGEQSK